MITLKLYGQVEPVGQYDRDTKHFIYYSTQDTFMRNMNSPRGIREEVVQWALEQGAEVFDIVMPSRCWRTDVTTLATKGRHRLFRNEAQYFLDAGEFTVLPPYDKPKHWDTEQVVLGEHRSSLQ